MFEPLIALSALVAGVVVVARLRRRQQDRSPTPNPTIRDGDPIDVGSGLEPEQPSAPTTMTLDADEPSVRLASAMGEQEREATPGTERRLDLAEPSELPRSSNIEPQPDPEHQPEAGPARQPESLLSECLLSADVTDSVDDDGDQSPSDERTRDGDALIQAVSDGSVDAQPIFTEAEPGIVEAQPRPPVAQAEIESLPFEASPTEFAAVSPDDGGEAKTPAGSEIEAVDLGIEVPLDGDPDRADGEEGEGEEGKEGKEGKPDVADGPEGEENAVQPEGAQRRYRPAPRLPRPARSGAPNIRDLVTRDRSLEMAVRLSFHPGGRCQFSLLAQRSSGLPEQIEVRGRDRTDLLRALQEDWYELKVPADLSGLLRDGAAWTTEPSSEVAARWTLASRDVYVLGVVEDFAGYVSTSRLTVGEDHVILCITGRREHVSAALTAAGCLDVQLIDASSGVPEGWIAIRNVKPSRSVPGTNDGDILDTLRPLANIEIQLEGGIKFDRSSWLEGHAPTIRITGDLASAGTVLIDDKPAPIAADGTCESQGQGGLGEHTVWSSSATRNYRVVRGMQEWTPWSAHPLANAMVCGAAVFPLPGSDPAVRQVVVPAGDFSLIGATPGTVLHYSRDVSSRSPVTVVFPWFDPVWIIPRFPLRCDRYASRITRISPHRLSPISAAMGHRDSQGEWSRLVLDAHRRKLIPDPSDEATKAVWLEYERVARSIWRRLR